MSLSKKDIEKRYNCKLNKIDKQWIVIDMNDRQIFQANNLSEVVEKIEKDILLISESARYHCSDFLQNYCNIGCNQTGIYFDIGEDNKFYIYYQNPKNIILKLHTYKLYYLILNNKRFTELIDGLYEKINKYIENCPYGYIDTMYGLYNLNLNEAVNIFKNNIKANSIGTDKHSIVVEYLKSDINYNNEKRDYPQCIGEECMYYLKGSKECCLGTYSSWTGDNDECLAPTYIQVTSMKLDEVEKWLRIIEKYNKKDEK